MAHRSCSKCHGTGPFSPGHSRCRACRRDDERERRAKNPGSYIAACMKWQAKHRDVKRALDRKWRAKHRETIRQKDKAYRAANLDKVRARERAYATANRPKKTLSTKRWCANNPERAAWNANKRKHNRRARERNAAHSLTREEWLTTLDVFDHRCAYCLLKVDHPQMDHVIAISRGGSHTADNVVPACGRCNKRKSAKRIFETLK